MESPTAVMITNAVNKDVVYSTEFVDESSESSDSKTQLLVEYSIMSLGAGAKPIVPVDTTELLKHIDGTLDIINGCIIAGAGFATFALSPTAPVLVAMAAVGAFIQFTVTLIPHNNPDKEKIDAEFKKLEKAIHELEEQADAHFADMKAFVSQHKFTENIVSDVFVLMSFLKDCLKYRGKQDLENFRVVYEQKTPLNMAYLMESILETRFTNPLKMAMHKESVKTKATFNKWKTIIMGIVSELVVIETFASGLLKKNTNNVERIVAQWNEIKSSIDKWETTYKSNQNAAYWEDFKKFLVPYVEKHTHLTNSQKADGIMAKLDSYFTSDAFYIVVMNETTWHKDYSYHVGKNENDHIAGSWGKGGCHAFVYRSKTGGKKQQNKYKDLRWRISSYALKKDWPHELKDIESKMIDKVHLQFYNFCCLMAPECHQEIRYMNHLIGPDNKGPGAYGSISRPVGDGENQEVLLMLAFE